MQRYLNRRACGIAATLLAAMPALAAPNFTYTETFDSVADGAKPPGWWTGCLNNATLLPGLPTMEPAVMSADPAGYGAESALTTARGYAANAGVVNYAVPWSGLKRFSIAHPAQGTDARSSEAWYVGSGGPHSGTYPMDLKHNSFKAEFDLSMRTGRSNLSTHNFTFAVQPSLDDQDFPHYGYPFGRGGWGMNGFSVEVDLFINDAGLDQGNGYGDPPRGDLFNGQTILPAHVGVNVQRMWDVLGYGVKSLKTNVEQGVAIPWSPMPTTDTALAQSPWCTPCNNNQPLHFTVYYNDPAHGGAGRLQIYLKVKATDKAASDPAVPVGQAPYSFGEEAGDPVEGKLMIDTCVGPWPGDGAIFGYTSGFSGSNHLAQVDNVHVETNAVDTSNPCPVAYPAPDPGLAVINVTLADSSVVRRNAPEFDFIADYTNSPATLEVAPTQTGNSGLSQPGWTVYTYPDLSDYWANSPILDYLEKSVAFCDLYGLGGPGVTGESDINYYDSGSGGNGTLALFRRTMPGMAALNNEWFGILAKGWAYFPPDTDGTNPYPRHYNFCINSDNGGRLRIGGQNVLDSGNDGVFRGINAFNQNKAPGTIGINAGYFKDVIINAPGVYPMQVMFSERYGGAYVEFYRRTDNAMAAFLPVGASKGGLKDQPVIYGLLNGQAPPTALDSANTAYTSIPSVTLDVNQRVGDASAATGSQVFTCKTVWGFNKWDFQGGATTLEQATARDIYWSQDEIDRTTALRWLDVLADRSNGTTTATIRYGNNPWVAELGNDASDFPGVPTTATAGTDGTQFAFRAEGYAVFPEAGTYWLGVVSEEQSYLWIGNQLLWSTLYFDEPGKIFKLDVPQAGTYPIRLELLKGANRGNQRMIRFYELVAGKSKVMVNGPGSRIKVYQSSTNPFAYKPHGRTIPASRKVAEVGQGSTLGWNGKVVKSSLDLKYMANATASIENNLYVNGPGSGGGPVRGLEDYDYPLVLNYWDETDPVDFVCCENIVAGFLPRWSTSALFWQQFGPNGLIPHLTPGDPANPGPGNDDFAASFTGYIEFPAPGYYAFNVQVEDTGMMWIAGQVVSLRDWTNGWPLDSQPAVVYVSQPGIYDIRVDYIEREWNAILAAFQILPDGTPVPLNDAAATVKVYRELSAAPTSTVYHNPTRVSPATKVSSLNGGSNRGFHVQFVNAVFSYGDGVNRAAGHDQFINLDQAHELLAAVLDGVPSVNQYGALAFDGIVNRLAFNPTSNGFNPYPAPVAVDDFPGTTQADYFAARAEGYIGLKAGGHVFVTMNDDGVRVTIGDQTWETGSGKGARGEDAFYIYVAEDGLYPFKLEYMELWGGAALHLIEVTHPTNPTTINARDYRWWEHAAGDGWEFVNDGDTVTKVYQTICPYPFADADGDGDVDQGDFGIFQACFDGGFGSEMAAGCQCFDRNTSKHIEVSDLTAFEKCITGPAIKFVDVQALLPECVN